MQYTYEEAVRELSDFIGKHVTSDNYWKIEKVLLTVLKGSEEIPENAYDKGYSAGYNNGWNDSRESYQEYD